MLRFKPNRKAAAALVSLSILAGSVTASTGANAQWGPHWGHPYYPHHYGYGYGYGIGMGGAALAGGLMLGALAANAAAAAAAAPPPPPPPGALPVNCKMQPKPMVDDYGNKYVGKVKVCS